MSNKNTNFGPFFVGGGKTNTNPNETTIKTFAFKMEGADLKIDHKPRRKNKKPHRRALVHDYNDGLTLNWAKDYPGGVTIKGNVNIPDKLIVKNKDVMSLITTLQNKINNLEKLYDMIDWTNS